MASAFSLCNHMNDRIGRATHRHRNHNRVFKGGMGLNFVWSEVFPDHVDNATTRLGAHAHMV